MFWGVFEEVIVWSVPGGGWMKGNFWSWVQRGFLGTPSAVIPSWSFVPSLYKGALERWGRRIFLTRCKQEKYMEGEPVCFLSGFWLRHHKMKVIFCPAFSPSPSLGMFVLSGNSASELSFLLLLCVLCDAIFQNCLAVHTDCRMLWVLESTSC